MHTCKAGLATTIGGPISYACGTTVVNQSKITQSTSQPINQESSNLAISKYNPPQIMQESEKDNTLPPIELEERNKRELPLFV